MRRNTLRSKLKRKKKLEGRLVQQPARLEMRIEGIQEEEGLDNERIGKKTAKKGKRILRKEETSLSQVEEELGMGLWNWLLLRLIGRPGGNPQQP